MLSKIHDSVQILSCSTTARVRNYFNLKKSYKQAVKGRASFHPALPFSISIEPTTACNLKCPECPSGLRSFHRPTGNLKSETFYRILDQLGEHLFYTNFYFQGEPFILPHFNAFVKACRGRGIYTSTSTNGHFLNNDMCEQILESGLNRLIVSIDGTTQETYEQYRIGGDLEKVKQGVKRLTSFKKKHGRRAPHVVIQFLVVKPNEHQISEAKKLCNDLGADEIRFKTAQVYDYKNGNSLIPENEKYSRYNKQKDGFYALKNDMEDSCWRMWSSCVFTWDGKIVPCCFDKDADHAMGSIMDHDFQEIWNGESYQKFRQTVFTGRDQIEICKNCTEGTKVWA